jgi:hypothetical protein
MAFLIIAGQTIRVTAAGSNAQQPFVEIGEEARAFSGALRNTIRAEKNVYKFVTALLPQSDLGTLRTNTALGALVSCSGDALNGTLTCRVRLGTMGFVKTRGGFRRQIEITLEEA